MPNPRISARSGQPVALDMTFYHNGVPANPFAIRKIEIYKTQIVPHNLVASIPLVDPLDINYPAPIQSVTESITGICGTEPVAVTTGRFDFIYTIPVEFQVPDVYFDLWYYYPIDPFITGIGTNATDPSDATNPTTDALNDPVAEAQLLKCCGRFWIYPDEWFCSDGLQTVRFGFEPLDQRFNSPEIRPLELGLMPLPLYDYSVNLVDPLIPFLTATITISTRNCEVLVVDAPMSIGLRQGAYRSNPWVLRYQLDTSKFLKGTYQYKVTLHLPDGSTRTSKSFIITIY